ncbi:MAG: substrate-binding domain-containing protein [Halanaerobiales bacterium]
MVKKNQVIYLFLLIVILVIISAIILFQNSGGDNERLILATTTSTENTGLLDELLPPFEEEAGYRVDVVAVGTGKALEMGRNGDADILLVHAEEEEKKFMNEGYGRSRDTVMYNDFILLGPASDPAGVENRNDILSAFAAVADREELFVSRGDDSGTHVKELDLWEETDVSPDGNWYLETGQGMGGTLRVANEKDAYVLSDRGTYLAYADDINLEVLLTGGDRLHNPYGVITVNSDQNPGVNLEGAEKLHQYLLSTAAREIIRDYRVEGKRLFNPVDK